MCSDGRGSEFSAVVRANEGWLSINAHQPGQRQDDVLTAHRSAHFDCQAVARVLVQDARHLERSAVGRLVVHEVICPHAVVRCRAGSVVVAATAAFPGPTLWQVQSQPAR